MIATLRSLSNALRVWHTKARIRRKIAQGHRQRARRAQAREVEVLRYDAQEALSLAETAISMLPDFSQRKFRRKLEHLRSRIG